jgi:streptogramin lyase
MHISQYHTKTIVLILTCLLCTACSSTSLPAPSPTPRAHSPTAISKPSPTAPPTKTAIAPQHYTAHVLLQGIGRPDDLVFDQQGNLLFSDPHNGTVSRLNANGTVTVLLHGLNGPEGMVELQNGTLIIAEQQTQRILALKPGTTSLTVLRTLPGIPSGAQCKDGVDGIGFDQVTNTLIIPDSPTGEVYRMSTDGKTLTLLAKGISRPVGAASDAQGNTYIADECGGAIWRITPKGSTQRIGDFGMPDDVALDPYGNLLVIDLAPSIHALIRMNLATGQRKTLASNGYIEPQGLVIDAHGDLFVSDDYANLIMEYTPA